MRNLVIEGQSLDWLLASATDAMLIVDGTGQIIVINPSLESLFGYGKGELIGQALETLIPARFRRAHIGLRSDYLSQPRPRSMGSGMELFAQRKDGSEFPVEISLSPLNAGEGVPAVLATIHDISARKEAEATLLQTRDALRDLAAHQENIREDERKRIAREVHDELGGLLSGIRAYISVSVERAVAAGGEPDPLLVDAASLAKDAIEAVRRVITDLRPSVLDQLGVWAALEWYVDQVAQRTGMRCTCTIDSIVSNVELDADRSTMLFRIVQEALTNVVRHANAQSVEVKASMHGELLQVSIKDDGSGIEASKLLNGESWGVLGMIERARHFGGELHVNGSTGQGTTLVLQLPRGFSNGGN